MIQSQKVSLGPYNLNVDFSTSGITFEASSEYQNYLQNFRSTMLDESKFADVQFEIRKSDRFESK